MDVLGLQWLKLRTPMSCSERDISKSCKDAIGTCLALIITSRAVSKHVTVSVLEFACQLLL